MLSKLKKLKKLKFKWNSESYIIGTIDKFIDQILNLNKDTLIKLNIEGCHLSNVFCINTSKLNLSEFKLQQCTIYGLFEPAKPLELFNCTLVNGNSFLM